MIERIVAGRVYYGWVIVAVMGVAGATVMALGTVNFGFFVKPMGDELGISRASFGWAQSLRQLAAAASGPLVGIILDRFGARWLLAGAATVTGVCLAGMGRIESAGEMMVLFVLLGLAGYAWPGTLMTSVPVMKWFVVLRGRALALMALGIPVGALIFLPLSQYWIDTLGWRNAWAALGALGVAIVVPISVIFLRRQPEDIGLEIDGGVREEDEAAPVVEHHWHLHEARRTGAFWTLTFVFSALALAVGMMSLHRIANFIDRGVDPSMVALATALDAVLAGVVTVAMGWLAGRFRPQAFGALGFVLLAASCVVTIYAHTPFGVFVAMGLFGAGIGGVMFVQNYIWADFFGRLHLGAIRGFTMPISLLVGAVGAPAAGYVKDVSGSYETVWWVSAAIMLVGGVAVWVTHTPRPALHSQE